MIWLRKANSKELNETVEHVNSVIHNVITNYITEMNNLLYIRPYVDAEKLGEMRKNRSNEMQKEPWWKKRFHTNIAAWRKK